MCKKINMNIFHSLHADEEIGFGITWSGCGLKGNPLETLLDERSLIFG